LIPQIRFLQQKHSSGSIPSCYDTVCHLASKANGQAIRIIF
jgi:hypothetical protein